jgi:hypothetical protein
MPKRVVVDGHPVYFSASYILQSLSDLGWEAIRDKSPEKTSDIIKNFDTLDPEVTQACDFACDHCWAPFSGQHMSLETFEKVLDLCDALGIKRLQLEMAPQFRTVR